MNEIVAVFVFVLIIVNILLLKRIMRLKTRVLGTEKYFKFYDERMDIANRIIDSERALVKRLQSEIQSLRDEAYKSEKEAKFRSSELKINKIVLCHTKKNLDKCEQKTVRLQNQVNALKGATTKRKKLLGELRIGESNKCVSFASNGDFFMLALGKDKKSALRKLSSIVGFDVSETKKVD